jgi:thioester reductase-like protein
VETYNVISPYHDGVGLDEYVDWLVEAGHAIERIHDNGEWLRRFRAALHALPERQREHTVLPLLHYLPDYERPQMPLGGARASAERFHAAVQMSKIGPDKDIPHVTASVIVKYIRNLQLIGMV